MKYLKNLKKKVIFLVFLFILCLSNCAPFLTTENNAIKNEIQEDFLPKLNAEMLNLTTPENKTYFEPTSGHYPDPHSFTHEAHGTMGANIDFVDTFWRSTAVTYLWARIDPEWYGHKNYLSLIDSQGGGNWLYVRHEGFNETSGAMEWYWGMTVNGATHDSYFRLMNGETQAFEIRLDGGSFAYTGSSSGTLTTFEANTWYHHRLLFDCTGAGNGRFTWIISHENGTEIDRAEDIEFTNNVASIDKIHIETPTTHDGGCRANFDAFGFSWEGYQLGENLHEGLLMSFKPDDLDWMGYSLDGQNNRTILGNNTIPLMENGPHTIQLFGNDTLGIEYRSEIRYFSIDYYPRIITPENKTYTEPMSGYYPATYGFENDGDGDDPEGWTIEKEFDLYLGIVSEIAGHKKVVEIYDGDLLDPIYMMNNFGAKDYGTIEFYIRTSDASQPSHVRVSSDDDTNLFIFGIIASKFQFWDGSWKDVGVDASNNTWYHIRIDFECTFGQYQNLARWDWQIEIDGIKYGDYNFNSNKKPAKLTLTTTISNTYNCYIHYDAIGYSWDPDYSIGDNKKEGLLLSINTEIELGWVAYSLDGQANSTILGNAVIPIPNNGAHKIQVFSSDLSGTIYQTDIRHFTIIFNEIDLITPENKTYAEPMSGYYPGTYGFENDLNGNFPDGWISSEPIGTSIQIIEEFNVHKKVLELSDDSNTEFSIVENSFSNQTYGTIEFWVVISDDSKYFLINIMIDEVTAINLRISLGKWWCEDGLNSIIVPNVNDPISNSWHHIRIHFECTSGGYQGLAQYKWNVLIDNIDSGLLNFFQLITPNHLNKITFSSGTTQNIYKSYIDSISYSWDPNYNIGDNVNEGLLLSFDSYPDLKSISYSLNGQNNILKSGNTTIPMPYDGTYKIQVFGSDYIGASYQSNIRYFSVDSTAPTSSIFYVPHSGTNIVNKSTVFILSADDGTGSGVSVIRYKINNSGWFDYSAEFDLSGYDPGYYLISYYSVDAVGNTENENMLLIELIEIPSKPSKPPAIPGYDILFLIGIICVVSGILLKNRYKLLNK